LLSPGGKVFERPNSIKERVQAKNDLEAEWVDTELYLNNELQNCPLATYDAPEKQYLDCPSWPNLSLQAWPLDLRAIEKCGFDNRLHEVEFG
jgi:hypothetical protein